MRLLGKALTFDDVLLVPAASEVMPVVASRTVTESNVEGPDPESRYTPAHAGSA